jgi:hypothetical protein
MRILLLSIATLISLSGKAVEFTSLFRSEPVTLAHSAEFTSYVDITLNINAERSSTTTLYLRLRYVIGPDTLHDLITVNGRHDGVVKQLLLKEGERLTAQILLHNAETDRAQDIEGSFRASVNSSLKVANDLGHPSFVGNVWMREQNPLFRVKFEDAASREVRLVFHLDGNYEFDDLHFRVKVISPEQGILFLPRSVKVTEGTTLDMREKSVKVDLDGVNYSYKGSYYFQVMHTMGNERVNGVRKVGYEVVGQ